MNVTRLLMVEKWMVYCWSQCGEGGESARPGWRESLWTLINSCTIVLKCLEWTDMSLLNVQCCVRTRVLSITLNQVCRRWLKGEHSRVLSFNHLLLLCVGEAPLLDLKLMWAGHHIHTPKKVIEWVFICAKDEHCNRSGFILGNKRSQMRFSDACFLILLNASDLPLNAWQPECVVHDTDP